MFDADSFDEGFESERRVNLAARWRRRKLPRNDYNRRG